MNARIGTTSVEHQREILATQLRDALETILMNIPNGDTLYAEHRTEALARMLPKLQNIAREITKADAKDEINKAAADARRKITWK